MTAYYISIGSNIGDRFSHLQEAVRALAARPEIEIDAVSSVYGTDPVGYTEQGEFLNMVARAQTELAPEVLLRVCLEIEQSLGRIRDVRWGPRTIDLDIALASGGLTFHSPSLDIPHPRLCERDFVLVPLLEIEPLASLPGGHPLARFLSGDGVRAWRSFSNVTAFLAAKN